MDEESEPPACRALGNRCRSAGGWLGKTTNDVKRYKAVENHDRTLTNGRQLIKRKKVPAGCTIFVVLIRPFRQEVFYSYLFFCVSTDPFYCHHSVFPPIFDPTSIKKTFIHIYYSRFYQYILQVFTKRIKLPSTYINQDSVDRGKWNSRTIL